MRAALVFISGCLSTATIVWLLSPPCGLPMWFAGFFCALIAMGITIFVEAALSSLGDDK